MVKDARTLDYVLINRSAEALYGIPRAQMIGKHPRTVSSPRERMAIIAKHDKYLIESGRSAAYAMSIRSRFKPI